MTRLSNGLEFHFQASFLYKMEVSVLQVIKVIILT